MVFYRICSYSVEPHTIYTLISEYIFYILLSLLFSWYWQENLFKNPECYHLMIISFILMTVKFDKGMLF